MNQSTTTQRINHDRGNRTQNGDSTETTQSTSNTSWRTGKQYDEADARKTSKVGTEITDPGLTCNQSTMDGW